MKVLLKCAKNNVYFTLKPIYTYDILLRIRNVSHKIYRENQNTRLMFNNFLSENHAVGEIMWKNAAERCRPHMTISCV
jgi:hypothetical protein